jgi:glycosyltransferase involved in cell wall biosynthesis
MQLSVVICTHQPKPAILARTLAGLNAQTLASGNWETLLIDNASQPAIEATELALRTPDNLHIVTEPTLGLTHARKAGVRAARSEIIVFVDDDNVLAPDYLEQTLAAFSRLSHVGALGGKSLPSFETEPPIWSKDILPLLALRDLGEKELVSSGLKKSPQSPREYPLFAPIGAGMAVRREAIQHWLNRESTLSDRRGNELTSSGDNDIVLTIMESGWEVAYLPQLALTHLIPTSRLEPKYLSRLNRGIQKSWTQVLAAHDISSWPPISHWTVPMRILKAWFTYRAWSCPAAYIRWQGACGHFEGRARSIRRP